MNSRIRRSFWVVLIGLSLALLILRLDSLADSAEANRKIAESAIQSVGILADQVEDLGAVPRVDPDNLPEPSPGPQGVPGLTGPPGRDGADGADGKNGKRGAAGARGLQGIPGLDGRDGAPGPSGSQGERGEKGEKGDTGETGAEGPPGPAGADGQDGADAYPLTFTFVLRFNPAQAYTCTVNFNADGEQSPKPAECQLTESQP